MKNPKITRDGKVITLTITMHQMQNSVAQGDDGKIYVKVGKRGKWAEAYITPK